MTRVAFFLLVALSAISIALGVALYQSSVEKAVQAEAIQGLVEAQNRAIERSKADAYTLVARDRNIAVQRRILTRTQKSLSKALERNKAWSDTDVPPDIIGGLAGPSGALPDGLSVPAEGQDCQGTPSSCPLTGVPSTVP